MLGWGLEKTEGHLVSLMFKCLVQLQNARARTHAHMHTVSGNSSGLEKSGRGSHLLTGRQHAENNRESQGTPEVTLIRLINLIDI